jgi:hypothetical protein
VGPAGVHPSGDRRLAVAHWLLTAALDPVQARKDWPRVGTVLLRCGEVFTAVRMPGRLVEAAAGTGNPACMTTSLRELTGGGGVWADRHSRAVYFLVPAETTRAWNVPGTQCLDDRYVVGVPWPGGDACEDGERTHWLVEMDAPGTLCSADAVAAVARRGRRALRRPPGEVPAAHLERVRQYVRQALDLTGGLPGTLPDPDRAHEVADALRVHVGVLTEWTQRWLDRETDSREWETGRWVLQRVRSRLARRPDGVDVAAAAALEALALDAGALAELVHRQTRAATPT